MDATEKLLKEITDLPGVPGFEKKVSAYIEEAMKPFAEVYRDKLGSVICKKEGTSQSPKIMLSGHMDEVGFMIKRCTDEGFLTFTTLGGWWSQVMLAKRVEIYTRKGPILGLIGSKPPHVLDAEERKKTVKKEDMYIDVGAKSKEDVEAMGIRPGDPVIPVSEFNVMADGDSLMAKAWDDRIGCALFMEILQELQGKEHPNTVYGVGSVQEEVGLRGAKTSAQNINPDIAFALEVSIAGDTPGVKPDQAQSKLGQGPAIFIYDHSLIPNQALRDWVIDQAETKGIPYQFETMEGGATDAGAIHLVGSGVPALVLGVPTRYVHSHSGILSRKDYELTKSLLLQIIMGLDKKTVEQFT